MGKQRLTTEIFIKRSIPIHGGTCDYSFVNYIDYCSKVDILCIQHNLLFSQSPAHHLAGQGCPKCRYEKMSFQFRSNKEEFIRKAILIHGDKFDYSLVIYVNNKTKVKIICRDCNTIIEQTPDSHLGGRSCKNCANIKIKYNQLNTEIYINRASKVFDNYYTYPNAIYINNSTNIKNSCPKHGEFEQKPSHHLDGAGCPRCANTVSKCEDEVANFLKLHDINIIQRDRKILNRQELDIYIPEYKLGIEYNGLYWHSSKHKESNFHLNKTELCEAKGVNIIHVFEDEWLFKKDIVKSNILRTLDLLPEIIINKIKLVDDKLKTEFLKENNIEGSRKTCINLGLFNDDTLVSIMCFDEVNHNFTIVRYCDKNFIKIMDSFNLLFEYFKNTFQFEKVKLILDRRWINKTELSDFNFIKNMKPKYKYCSSQNRINKNKNGKLHKIYDAGYKLYELN